MYKQLFHWCIFVCMVWCSLNSFAEDVSDSSIEIDPPRLSLREKRSILNRHNDYRGFVAQGRVPYQPLATNMNSLFWDNALSDASFEWLKECIYKIDSNRSNKLKNNFYNKSSFAIPTGI